MVFDVKTPNAVLDILCVATDDGIENYVISVRFCVVLYQDITRF